MSILVSPATEERIKRIVDEGYFPDADALVGQLLDSWESEYTPEEEQEIRAAIAEGIEQSDRGEGVSLEEFMERQRLHRSGKAH